MTLQPNRFFSFSLHRLSALVLAAMLIAIGCDSASPPDALENAAPSGEAVLSRNGNSGNTSAQLNKQLAELRRATARFHRFEEVQEAGHTVLVPHPETGAECLEHPTLGAMGLHYLNPNLADGAVSITAPEVVIYEPQRNGKLRLVGFEYVIPFAVRDENQAPPVLFGREFKRNYTFNLWALHVWAWKHNPGGMFADWNPKVTCEHADT